VFSGPKRSLWLVLAATLFVSTSPIIAHSQNKPGKKVQAQNLTLDQIVNRMEQERIRTKQTPPFLLTREYKLFHGDDAKPTSDVKAQISVSTPSQRDYKIVSSEGSDRGEKVVRKILAHEAAAEKVTPSPTGITRDNYDFTDLGRAMFEGVNCYVLGLKPKRQDPGLVEGRAWVDPNTFAIRKIEGKMSKSPSWWVKDVDLVINFGEIGGLWMQTESQATADVRIIGQYTVRGRALNVQTGDAVAANVSPTKHGSNFPATFVYGGPVGHR
jgi:hypothetical protein